MQPRLDHVIPGFDAESPIAGLLKPEVPRPPIHTHADRMQLDSMVGARGGNEHRFHPEGVMTFAKDCGRDFHLFPNSRLRGATPRFHRWPHITNRKPARQRRWWLETAGAAKAEVRRRISGHIRNCSGEWPWSRCVWCAQRK